MATLTPTLVSPLKNCDRLEFWFSVVCTGVLTVISGDQVNGHSVGFCWLSCCRIQNISGLLCLFCGMMFSNEDSDRKKKDKILD